TNTFVVVPMSTTSLGGVMLSRSITPCGSTSRTRSGKTRVKASAMGKLMSRTLGFRSNELIVGASGNPAIHTTSTLLSLSAASVAPPPKGSSVAVVESTPLLPRSRSAENRSRRALPVRDASENEANLNSRVWILQKLDVVQRAGSFAQLQLNVRTRKNVAVSLANVFKRGTLEPRSHRDGRRGRSNEIDQQHREYAYCNRA